MNLKKLFVKKPMRASSSELEEEERHALKKHLGAFDLTTIGIGAIIGAGIFVVIGEAAANFAGPAITLSFMIAAIVCIFAGLCYAELSSLIPISGGSYTYAYIALGEFPAWIVGWLITAQYLFSSSTVSVGWSGYCTNILKNFGLSIPDFLTQGPVMYTPGIGWEWSGALINLPAVVLVAIVGVFMSVGIKAAANFNNIMVAIKLATVALFIILGIAFVNTDNWTPFVPENTGIFGHFGWSGILRGAGLVFFAYIGFDTISTMAQEAKNPQRDLPRGILGSLGICTITYIITALILTGIVSYKFLGVADPMSVALDAMGSQMIWVKMIIKLAILLSIATVVLVQLMALTRIFMAMSHDGLLPRVFSKVHPKTQTPLFSSVLTTVCGMCIAGLFPLAILGELVVMSTLFIFAIVCLGVLILRYTHPKLERSFKVPFVPYIPIAGIVCCLLQMSFLPLETWLQLLVWLAIGLTVYFKYSRRHSKIQKAHHS